ncbi:hypothetical protein RchiOBHm_Chr3g0456651 [Rosa chinensis]|uniref:Uncharacterized protein n=1 Tax=Rosa chinensis TaxID=74649 RepID=A0A2P6R7D2_ROSCH|nr:hypothetical protein RchiOBHm_Chr3g0456651 [Rosa chinensis]
MVRSSSSARRRGRIYIIGMGSFICGWEEGQQLKKTMDGSCNAREEKKRNGSDD